MATSLPLLGRLAQRLRPSYPPGSIVAGGACVEEGTDSQGYTSDPRGAPGGRAGAQNVLACG